MAEEEIREKYCSSGVEEMKYEKKSEVEEKKKESRGSGWYRCFPM